MDTIKSLFSKNDGKSFGFLFKGMTIELIVKITTNYKLNLVEPSGQKLILPGNTRDEEVHFVKFEGIYPDFEISRQNMGRPIGDAYEFKDWTIVDIDNYLKGNSHI